MRVHVLIIRYPDDGGGPTSAPRAVYADVGEAAEALSNAVSESHAAGWPRPTLHTLDLKEAPDIVVSK